MSTSNPQPQVGAIPGNISDYPRLPKLPVHNPNWTVTDDLAAADAVNFVSAKPETLSAGTVLYRVFGGSAHAAGYYWSFTKPPKNQGDWRAEDAVELSWNAGNQWEKGIVKSRGAKVWVGPASAQPAQDTNDNLLPGYLLPGGAIQLNVVSLSDLDIVPLGAEDWQG